MILGLAIIILLFLGFNSIEDKLNRTNQLLGWINDNLQQSDPKDGNEPPVHHSIFEEEKE